MNNVITRNVEVMRERFMDWKRFIGDSYIYSEDVKVNIKFKFSLSFFLLIAQQMYFT